MKKFWWRPLALLAVGMISISLACNYPGLGTHSTPQPSPTATLPPATPTPTATPTPPPTPTPEPAARISIADQFRMEGDWERSIQEYQTAMQADSAPAVRSAALLGLGQAQFAAGDYSTCVETLSNLIQAYPDSPELPYAYFYLGRAYAALGDHTSAADAYLNYLTRRSGLAEAYVYNLRGDELWAAGDYAGALRDYRAALQSPSMLTGLLIEIKIAQAHAALSDYETALGMYQDIYNRAQTDYTKAQMDYLAGQAFTALGQMEKAYAAYQDAVAKFPSVNSAYLSLLALVNANVPVDELSRGIVDYYAGQYGVAMAAFDRYFRAGGAETDKARYYNGLTLRAVGNYSAAISEFDKIIQNYPESPLWDDAWEQKAYTQYQFQLEQPGGIQTLLDFVRAAPGHPRAAEFLFDAAQVAESIGDLRQAAELWEQVSRDYPGDERVQRALFLAGVSRYRMGDYSGALSTFQHYLENATTLEERSAAHFWEGKVYQAMQENASAQAAWEMASSVDPTGYYSERAKDILRGRQPFTPPENMDLGYDLEAERPQAEAWMRAKFALGDDVDLSGLGMLADDSRLQRGRELLELGLYDEARMEFENLRQSVVTDPVNSYRLANYLLDIGMYRSAILATRQVLNLAGMSDMDTLNAPIYFNHIRFGTYYSNLILPAARQFGLHPLLLFSVIRQESAFEGLVSSSAGARGLMQIIPETGREIAASLGWPENYTDADLYRPFVNVIFGSKYLAKWRDYFGGDLFAALAAYNGGPGNAMEWKKASKDDPDVFLEIIRYEETRNYIRGVYEIFNLYRGIYERRP